MIRAVQTVNVPSISSNARRGGCLATGFVFLFLAVTAHAQESFRASIAGEEAAAQQKKETANLAYNLKLGALKLRFASALNVEASDNVNRLEFKRTADMSLRPSFDVTAMLPVTDRHTFVFTIGGGYAKYLRSKQLDHIFITPNSTLSYDMYAGDCLINLHSRFTYTEEDYQQYEISRTAEATLPGNGYFKNLTGSKVTWDLGKLQFVLGFDHEIYQATKKTFEYQNHASELVSFSGAVQLNPTTFAGIQLGGGFTAYDKKGSFTNVTVGVGTNAHVVKVPIGTFLADQLFYNFGPVIICSPTEHLKMVLYAGYTIYQSQSESSFAAAASGGSTSAFYCDFKLDHELNHILKYSFNLGRQIRLGINSDTSDIAYAIFTPQWNLIRNVSLSTPLRYSLERPDK
ncbi:MAG: hypothetical protein RL380_1735, partial [Verrucomicrobiota bacterium]